MSNKRIDDLEAKIAFLEDALEKISDEFFLQQKELISLRDQQSKLVSQIRSLSESSRSEEYSQSTNDEKPPHY